MKYTRYDIVKKRKSSRRFELVTVCILLSAVVIGTLASNIFFKGINDNKATVNSERATNNASDIINYTFLQCGVFSKKENADELQTELNKIGTPFEVEEDGKIRVFFGIYNSTEDVNSAVKLLSDNKFENHAIKYNLNKNDACDLEIVDIINANLQIINKLSDKSITGIQTTELKNWISKLKKIEGNYKHLKVLKDIEDYSNKLPKQYTRDNLAAHKTFIYNELKAIGKN